MLRLFTLSVLGVLQFLVLERPGYAQFESTKPPIKFQDSASAA